MSRAMRAPIIVLTTSLIAVALASSSAVAETPQAGELMQRALARLQDSYARAPALVVGLAALLILPPLAISGAVIRWLTRPAPRALPFPTQPAQLAEVGPAWIEIADAEGAILRRLIDRPLLQIGRQDDNDIHLDESTVHRYHAIIQRSDDLGLMIMDVSGEGGNGVRLNGERIHRAPLSDGDEIELGAARLRISFTVADTANAELAEAA